EAAARAGDDRAVFGTLARNFLEVGVADPSFLRILLYTALEGHDLSAPFFAKRIRRLREFVAGYIAQRIREGAFRPVDPVLGARPFRGRVVDSVMGREIFQQRDASREGHPPQQVADTFVSIFLDGIRRRDGGSDV